MSRIKSASMYTAAYHAESNILRRRKMYHRLRWFGRVALTPQEAMVTTVSFNALLSPALAQLDDNATLRHLAEETGLTTIGVAMVLREADEVILYLDCIPWAATEDGWVLSVPVGDVYGQDEPRFASPRWIEVHRKVPTNPRTVQKLAGGRQRGMHPSRRRFRQRDRAW